MPLYEYKCQSCGKIFEVLQKFADDPLSTHPDCGGAVERLLSAPAFHLKGSGWYATDYAKPGAKSAKTEKAEASGSTSSDSKSDGKSDTKPESKPESKAETKSASSSETKSPAPTPSDSK